jgi:hypothetical protein
MRSGIGPVGSGEGKEHMRGVRRILLAPRSALWHIYTATGVLCGHFIVISRDDAQLKARDLGTFNSMEESGGNRSDYRAFDRRTGGNL